MALPTAGKFPGRQPFHPPPILSKERRRCFHSQSFMRSVPVVMPQPTGAAFLLCRNRRLRLGCHFRLVNPMELLVRAILAGSPRRDEFHRDSQLHPPRTQTRQSGGASAPKGRAVITPDALGHPMSFEKARGLPARHGHLLGGQEPYAQNVSAIKIADCQGLHSLSLARAVPPFKVDRPNFVARLGNVQRFAQKRGSAAAPPSSPGQAPTLKPTTDGGCGRSVVLSKAMD